MRQPSPARLAVIALGLLVLLAHAVTTTATRTPPPSPAPAVRGAESIEVQFDSVIDGDTIRVRTGGKVEKVRLLCIDTVERGEPGYKEAGDYLRELIGTNTLVWLTFDPKHDRRDRYRRLLAYVQIPNADDSKDDVILNVEMIRGGHSRYWVKYGRSSINAAQFEEADRGFSPAVRRSR